MNKTRKILTALVALLASFCAFASCSGGTTPSTSDSNKVDWSESVSASGNGESGLESDFDDESDGVTDSDKQSESGADTDKDSETSENGSESVWESENQSESLSESESISESESESESGKTTYDYAFAFYGGGAKISYDNAFDANMFITAKSLETGDSVDWVWYKDGEIVDSEYVVRGGDRLIAVDSRLGEISYTASYVLLNGVTGQKSYNAPLFFDDLFKDITGVAPDFDNASYSLVGFVDEALAIYDCSFTESDGKTYGNIEVYGADSDAVVYKYPYVGATALEKAVEVLGIDDLSKSDLLFFTDGYSGENDSLAPLTAQTRLSGETVYAVSKSLIASNYKITVSWKTYDKVCGTLSDCDASAINDRVFGTDADGDSGVYALDNIYKQILANGFISGSRVVYINGTKASSELGDFVQGIFWKPIEIQILPVVAIKVSISDTAGEAMPSTKTVKFEGDELSSALTLGSVLEKAEVLFDDYMWIQSLGIKPLEMGDGIAFTEGEMDADAIVYGYAYQTAVSFEFARDEYGVRRYAAEMPALSLSGKTRKLSDLLALTGFNVDDYDWYIKQGAIDTDKYPSEFTLVNPNETDIYFDFDYITSSLFGGGMGMGSSSLPIVRGVSKKVVVKVNVNGSEIGEQAFERGATYAEVFETFGIDISGEGEAMSWFTPFYSDEGEFGIVSEEGKINFAGTLTIGMP